MNVFDLIRDVIAQKKGTLLDDPDNAIAFKPYLMQRWVSFFNNGFAKLANESSNRLYPVFGQKEMWYKFFLVVIPKMRFHKIRYIKKIKDKSPETSNSKIIEFIAKQKQISTREAKELIELSNFDLKGFKRRLNE